MVARLEVAEVCGREHEACATQDIHGRVGGFGAFAAVDVLEVHDDRATVGIDAMQPHAFVLPHIGLVPGHVRLVQVVLETLLILPVIPTESIHDMQVIQ